jgi:small subunit ribosomal protein S2
VQRFQEEIDDLNKKYGGIKELNGKPGAVFVTDIMEDKNAVAEANKLGVPVIAIVDTNADPSKVDYVIPGNDDAIKGLSLILDYVAQAIEEGKKVSAVKAEK